MTDSALLNERSQRLLRALVQTHALDGSPVGSRTLAREAGLDLSAATVRNVMADLERLGLVRSPHTSAGRIPTAKGMRFFVDSLLTVKPLDRAALLQLEGGIAAARKSFSADDILSTASGMLSSMTHLAGLVSVPKVDQVLLRQIEFLPLGDCRVLAILVLNDNDVQNRVLETQRNFDRRELEQAANFLTQRFAGRALDELRTVLTQELHSDRANVNEQMHDAIQMADQALEPQRPRDDYMLSGETNLMRYDELSNSNSLRELFEAFAQKRDILHLLDRCLDARGVRIYIGEESGFSALDECSLVTAPYTVNSEVMGVLGVIGPTRMAYDRVIPLVDATARLLSLAMSNNNI